jgi:zinc protease
VSVVPGDCQRAILGNGLRVVLAEDHLAPSLVFKLWVSAGSASDPPGLAGLAHCLEHMVLKRTSRGELLAAEAQKQGGLVNADTDYDHTYFRASSPSRRADAVLALLVDAVLRPPLDDPRDFQAEVAVILEEMRQIRHTRLDLASDSTVFRTVFRDHPYERSGIGTSGTVRCLRLKDLRAFHGRYYAPANMALVAAGSITLAQLSGLARELFPSAEPRPAPGGPAKFPVQSVPRVRLVRSHVPAPHLSLNYRTAPLGDPDAPALEVLSARLVEAVRRGTGGAAEAMSTVERLRLDGVLRIRIDAHLGPEDLPGAAEGALRGVASLFRRPDRRLLAQTKQRVIASAVFEQATLEQRTQWAGVFETYCNDARLQRSYFERVAALAPADVERAARRFFRPERLSIVVQVPMRWSAEDVRQATDRLGSLCVDPRFSPPVASAGQTAPWAIVPAGTGGERRTRRRTRSPESALLSSVSVDRFPGGTTAIVAPRPGCLHVAVVAAFPGGIRYETEESNGIGTLIAQTLLAGTRRWSRRQLEQRITALGGHVRGEAAENSLSLQGTFVAHQWREGLELIAGCLLEPCFPRPAVDEVQAIIRSILEQEELDLDDQLDTLLARHFFQRHPYRLPALGTLSSLRFTPSDLLRFYEERYPIGRCTLAVAGDLEPREVRRSLRALLAHARRRIPAPPAVSQEPPRTAEKAVFLPVEKDIAALAVAFPAPASTATHWPALRVLEHVLFDSSGRIVAELRARRGIVYQAYGDLTEGADPGMYRLRLTCGPGRVEEALSVIEEQIEDLRARPIDEEELGRAKARAFVDERAWLLTSEQTASHLAVRSGYGLTLRQLARRSAAIERTTAVEIQAHADRLLDASQRTIVVIGPRRLGRVVARTGAVITERSLR